MNGGRRRAHDLVHYFANFVTTWRVQYCAAAGVVLFLATLARYWVSYDPSASFVGSEGWRLAHNLLNEHQFANPFEPLDTGPSALETPAWLVLLALLMKTFGGGNAGDVYAIRWAAVLIIALTTALFPVFSRRLGMGELNGIIGASIWILAKPMMVPWYEFYGAILLAVTCYVYREYLEQPAQGAGRLAWILGCLMGILMLTIPGVAPILAAGLAWEIWRRKIAFFKVSLLPLVLLPALIVTPWTVRNYLVFHSLVPIRDNLGLELSQSNNDCAQFSALLIWNSVCPEHPHPNANLNEARKVLELGEAKYCELRLHEALHWIGDHPARFLKLTAMRFVFFWMPNESGTVVLRTLMPELQQFHVGVGRHLERVVIYLMTLLSGAGLLLLYKKDARSAAICMSCLTLYPLVYYIVQFEDRYRYPIMWVTFLLGALPITTYMTRFWQTLYPPDRGAVEGASP
jgi:hypothetical protein